MNKYFERIKKLTDIDMQHKKTSIHLFASLMEEIGEFARELKIEEKVFGNTYKKPDEGTLAELVDVEICCWALVFSQLDHLTLVFSKLDFQLCLMLDTARHAIQPYNMFESLGLLVDGMGAAFSKEEGAYRSFIAATFTHAMFEKRGGTTEQFEELMTKKLDKWEATQNETSVS